MTTAVAKEKYVPCADRIAEEIKRLQAILDRRGQWYEDEAERHKALSDVVRWMAEDKAENDRIELAAMEAEETAEEERKKNDPNYKTRKLFEGVHIKVPERKRG